MATKEYKQIDLVDYEITEDDDSWTIKGWAATYDWDRGADKIVPGAMIESIKRRHQDRINAGRVSEVKFLYQHKEECIIGTPLVMIEDMEKGLWVEAKFIKDDDFPEARRAYKLAKMGYLVSFSIGYLTLDSEPRVKVKGQPRLLKKIDILEFSLVAIAMNEFADVEEVKMLDTAITQEFQEEEYEMSEAELKSLAEQLVQAVRGAVLEALTPAEPEAVETVEEAAVAEEVAEKAEVAEIVEPEVETNEEPVEEKAAGDNPMAALTSVLQSISDKMDLVLGAVLKDAVDDASEEDMACQSVQKKSTDTEDTDTQVETKSQDQENDLEAEKGFLQSLKEIQATFTKEKV